MIHFQINPVAYIQDIQNRSYADLFSDPLHYALTLEQQKATQMQLATALLENQMPVDKVDCHGMTLLMWASEQGHADIVALLLQQGANPELTDSTGDTALIKAVRKDNIAIVELLLKHKVDTEKADVQGNTALAIVVNDYTQYYKRTPGETCNIDSRKYQNKTVANIFKLLLKHGANPEVMLNTSRGQCTLWTAIVKCYSLGFDIEWIKSLKRKNPAYLFQEEFSLACEDGFVHGVRALLKVKPSLLAQNKDCVRQAVKAKYTELVGVLLAKASPVLRKELINNPEENGDTPLQIAFKNNSSAIASHLLTYGDDITKLRSTDADRACYKKRLQTVAWTKMFHGYVTNLRAHETTPTLLDKAANAVYQNAQNAGQKLKNLQLPPELVQHCETTPKRLQLFSLYKTSPQAREFLMEQPYATSNEAPGARKRRLTE